MKVFGARHLVEWIQMSPPPPHLTFREAFLIPKILKHDADFHGVVLLVPHQELLSCIDGSTAPVENPSLVLERHEILLIFITSAIYIPEKTKKIQLQIFNKTKIGLKFLFSA